MGLIIGANFKYNESEVIFTPFEINSTSVESYGNYVKYNQSGVIIRGEIIRPQNARYSSCGLRPAVFFFHGLFARKEFHYHYAIELARAGFVVICPDHGGMGESVGTFQLGWDIIPFVMTLFDHLPVLNSTYNLRINATKVGATGHSYGGISTTFAGIYRSYNQSTGIGVSACASIWTWSNITETVEYMVGEYGSASWDLLELINIEDAFNNPYGYENLIANLEARNVIDKVNGTSGNYLPPNWLLITSWDDGLVLPEWQMEIMAHACYDENNPSITPEIYENYISGNMTYANNFTWNNTGSFEDMSMRKIFLPRDTYGFPMGHLTEGFLVPPLVMILDWFGNAFDWNVTETIKRVETEVFDLEYYIPFWPAPIQMLVFEMYLGPILIINGLILIILPLISYFARGKRRDDEYQTAQFRFPKATSLPWKETIAFGGIFAGIYFFTSIPSTGISQILGLKNIFPYIIADALISSWTIRALIAGVILVPILIFIFNRYDQTFKDIGLDLEKKKIIRALFVGISVPLIFIGLWDLLNAFTTFPMLIPIASPNMGYFGFILVLIFLFLSSLVEEIYLRGLIQTKFEAKIQESNRFSNRRLKKWIAYILMVFFSLFINSSATIISILFTTGPLAFSGNISGTNFAMPFMMIGVIYSLIPSIINPYIYQRTRSVWACVLFSTILLSFLFTCRLGLGATTF
jgi:hypothetical protein